MCNKHELDCAHDRSSIWLFAERFLLGRFRSTEDSTKNMKISRRASLKMLNGQAGRVDGRNTVRSPTLLATLLLVNLVASTLHFADNMLRFGEYPEPKWIAGPHIVDALWLVVTPLLAAGWWLARREMKWLSVGILWLYGGLSMFVLGHYLYASPTMLTFRINILIGMEAMAALLLILLAPVAASGMRDQQRHDPTA